LPPENSKRVARSDAQRLASHNRIAFISDGTFFTVGLSFLEANTVLPTFVSTLTGSPILIGLVSSIRSMGYFLPQIFVAGYIEKMRRKKPFMMKVGLVMRLAALGIAFSAFLAKMSNFFALLVFYVSLVILSFSDGFGGLPWMDIVAKTIPSDKRAGLFGIMQALGGSCAFFAGFLVRWLLGKTDAYPLNYFYVFLLGFLSLTGSLVSMHFILEPDGKVRDSHSNLIEYLKRLPSAWRQDSLFRKVIAVRVMCGAIFLALPFFAIHAQEALNFPKSVVGLFVSAQMLGTVIGGPVWGYIGDRHGSFRIVRTITILCMGVGIFALLARLTYAAGAILLTYAIYYLLYFCLGGFFAGNWIGFSNYVLDIAPEESRATFVGLLNTVAGPLTLLSLVGGWILEKMGFVWLFALEIVIQTLAAFYAWRLPDSRNYRR